MKKFMVLSIVLLSLSMSGYSQFLTNKKDARIEGLNDTIKVLTNKTDSLQKLLDNYAVLYMAFKEKLIKQDFDPNRSAILLDSLIATVDSTDADLVRQNELIQDSLLYLNRINKQLISRADSLILHQQYIESQVVMIDLEKAKAIENLKKLKELLDDEIITPAEFLQLKRKYLNKL